MDLGAFFGGFRPFDLVAFIILGVGLFSGVLQGAVRRLIGIAIAIFVLVLALNLRAPVGGLLARYWTRDTVEYSEFIALGATFAVLYVTAMLAAQVYVKPMPLFSGATVANEIVGGIAGIVEAVIVLGAVILIMDTYFRGPSMFPSANELGVVRTLFTFYDDSMTAHVCREWLIPGFMIPFGWTVPETVRVLVSR